MSTGEVAEAAAAVALTPAGSFAGRSFAQDAQRSQPRLSQAGPACDGLFRGPESVTVASDRIQMSLGRNLHRAQSGVVHQSILHPDAVIFGLDQETRRRVGTHL